MKDEDDDDAIGCDIFHAVFVIIKCQSRVGRVHDRSKLPSSSAASQSQSGLVGSLTGAVREGTDMGPVSDLKPKTLVFLSLPFSLSKSPFT